MSRGETVFFEDTHLSVEFMLFFSLVSCLASFLTSLLLRRMASLLRGEKKTFLEKILHESRSPFFSSLSFHRHFWTHQKTVTMAASSFFSGEVCRNWRFTDAEGGSHEVALYHHPLTGARAAMVDHEELPGSLGTSSVFHGSATSMPFEAGSSRGTLHIFKDRMMGFKYSCVVDGKTLEEATRIKKAQPKGKEVVAGQVRVSDDDPLYTARVMKCETSRDHSTTNGAISWYLVRVESVATKKEATRVHRRFRDFTELDDTVTAAFAGHHMRSSMPPLPSKKIKFMQDHLDSNFLETRRAELDAYVDRLCRVPHVWSTPGMEPFFGVASNAREYSFLFTQRTLGFTVGKCGPKKSPENGDKVYEPPDFPAFVASIDPDALVPGLKVGDLISKISGKATCNWPFKAVVNAVKDSPRPLIVHFIGGKHTPVDKQHDTTQEIKNVEHIDEDTNPFAPDADDIETL